MDRSHTIRRNKLNNFTILVKISAGNAAVWFIYLICLLEGGTCHIFTSLSLHILTMMSVSWLFRGNFFLNVLKIDWNKYSQKWNGHLVLKYVDIQKQNENESRTDRQLAYTKLVIMPLYSTCKTDTLRWEFCPTTEYKLTLYVLE